MRMHSQKVSGKKAWSKLRRQEAIAFYLFILPWIIGFFLFYLGPMLGSLYFSFTKWDLLTPPELVGLANYVRIFTRDPLFLQSLKVTVIYTLAYIPLDMAFGLLIAVLMNRKIRGIGALRTIYYMPSVLSGVAYVVMWMWMFHPQNGLINNALFGLGIEGPRWLLDPQWALSALVIMSLWGVGRSMVIYLAGLQDISPELYEAASIDGANIWQKI
jgi:multiple sugar transport system permease protein